MIILKRTALYCCDSGSMGTKRQQEKLHLISVFIANLKKIGWSSAGEIVVRQKKGGGGRFERKSEAPELEIYRIIFVFDPFD
jgi:hypothetical protein